MSQDESADSHFVVPKPHVIQVNQAAYRISMGSVMMSVVRLPSDSRRQIVVISKMAQQRDLPQCPPGQDDLVKDPRDALDRDRLAAQRVLDRNDETVRSLTERSDQLPP